jgi:hypothetical protein
MMAMMGAMTAAGGIVSGIGGIAKVAGSFIGRKARIAEQKRANAELAKRKAEYEGMDITNPYANLENTYEDLEVNTQQAEFIARQNQQQQANIMERKGAADAARQRATDMMVSGVGDIAGGVMSFGMGNKMAGKGFWGGDAS